VTGVVVKIQDFQSPANLEPIGAAGSAPWDCGRDLAPLSAISVVPLSQAPQIITRAAQHGDANRR
jgi:hypothetical protein